jgi:hypothetical protein
MRTKAIWAFPLALFSCRSPDLAQPFEGPFQFTVTGTAPLGAEAPLTGTASGTSSGIVVTGTLATDCGAALTARTVVHPRTGGYGLELTTGVGAPCVAGSPRMLQSWRATIGAPAGPRQVLVRYGVSSVGPFQVVVG